MTRGKRKPSLRTFPELVDLSNKVVRITAAISQREVVPITVFGKLGEIVTKYVVPGDPVHVMARVSSTEFKADSGATRRSISVIAESVQLIPKGRKEESKK